MFYLQALKVDRSLLTALQSYLNSYDRLYFAVQCPGPGLMANTESITQTRQHIGDETTYNCETGYYFLDGKTSQTVACQSNGMWATTTSVCRSKSISHKQIHVRTMGSGLQQDLFAQVHASVTNILEQISAFISSSLIVLWNGSN